MRRVVISDLHFGDRNGCDLLRHPWAYERLWPLLDQTDQLILLGDTFELVFQHMQEAITASRPFFSELSRRYPGLSILIIPGNHDHHLVARAADERRERFALGEQCGDRSRVEPAERLVQGLCPTAQVSSAYPLYIADGVCFTHGHYLATHLESLGQRLYDRLSWKIWGQPRRQQLQIDDYEALISPLYELWYQMAQLPEGIRWQQQLEQQAIRIARLAQLPGQVGDQLARFAQVVQSRSRRRDTLQHLNDPVSAIAEVLPAPDEYLDAMGKVALNLGLTDRCQRVVFGHTHQPLVDAQSATCPALRFSNTGSFFYDWREMHRPDYRDRFWPGTALTVTPDGVQLHRLLEDLSLEQFDPEGRLAARHQPLRNRAADRLRRARRQLDDPDLPVNR